MVPSPVPQRIGLHDINPFAGGHRLKLRNVRMLDKELQAAALRPLLAQKRGDLVYQPQQLIFIVGRIIYDAQVRVPRPRGDQPSSSRAASSADSVRARLLSSV